MRDNTRRMVATAAPLSDHVLPPLPLRQWVLSVPKRLRYFLRDAAALHGVVVRLLLRAVARCRRQHHPGSSAAARLGAVLCSHRCGSALNAHRHCHCCISGPARLRDLIAHHYFALDVEIVWEVATTHVPRMLTQTRSLRDQADRNNSGVDDFE